jgi:hypothetical protein
MRPVEHGADTVQRNANARALAFTDFAATRLQKRLDLSPSYAGTNRISEHCLKDSSMFAA